MIHGNLAEALLKAKLSALDRGDNASHPRKETTAPIG
jgi:hypothetical protein